MDAVALNRPPEHFNRVILTLSAVIVYYYYYYFYY